MMICSQHVTRRALLIAGFFLVIPLVTLASFDGPFSVIKSVGLQATVQVDGKPMKSPVTVGTDSDFSIVWKSAGTGCVSNWDEDILPSTGSAVGSITKNRAFVITCFGRGAGQSATIQVNIGVADLITSSLGVSGLKADRKKKGSYFSAPFTFKASIRNIGKLSVSKSFRVKYEESSDKTNWISIGEQAVNGLPGGATFKIDDLTQEPPPDSTAKYYQVCVDAEEAVDEVKEDNNCSKILGPYTFVAVP